MSVCRVEGGKLERLHFTRVGRTVCPVCLAQISDHFLAIFNDNRFDCGGVCLLKLFNDQIVFYHTRDAFYSSANCENVRMLSGVILSDFSGVLLSDFKHSDGQHLLH